MPFPAFLCHVLLPQPLVLQTSGGSGAAKYPGWGPYADDLWDLGSCKSTTGCSLPMVYMGNGDQASWSDTGTFNFNVDGAGQSNTLRLNPTSYTVNNGAFYGTFENPFWLRNAVSGLTVGQRYRLQVRRPVMHRRCRLGNLSG